MIKQLGYRGYISRLPVAGGRVPQSVQQLVIRDYCAGNNMHLLLSTTEYAVPNCHIMLEQVFQEAVNNQGVVLYSLFQLPRNSKTRHRIYDIILENNIELHMALEGLVIKDNESVQRVEDIWLVDQTLRNGNYGFSHKHDSPEKVNSDTLPEFRTYGGN